MQMIMDIISKNGSTSTITADRDRTDDDLNLDNIVKQVREENPDWDTIVIKILK